jgi:mono/diheme cytochrome c family protein
LSAAEGSFEALRFLGRLHPLWLHLPIGGLVGLALLEPWLGAQPAGRLLVLRRVAVLALALAGLGTAGSGWLLGEEGGYAKELLEEHRRLGLIAAGLLLALAFAEFLAQRSLGTWLRRGLLLMALFAMGAAGHHGGQLTHGSSFLSRYAPVWLKPLLQEQEPSGGLATKGATTASPGNAPQPDNSAAESPGIGSDAVSGLQTGAVAAGSSAATTMGFAAVERLLQERCSDCHGPDKQKGGLRLDTPAGILGTLVPGSPAESELFYRVTLAPGHEEAMPTEGESLSAAEVLLLFEWIRAGAHLEDPVSSAGAGASVGANLPGVGAAERATGSTGETKTSLTDLLAEVSVASGASLELLPDSKPSAVRADFSLGSGPLPEDSLASLAALQPQLQALDLSGRELSLAALQGLPDMPNLRSARLAGVQLPNAGLGALLQRAPALESLNLYGTRLTADAVRELAAARSLRTVHLAETGLSAAQLTELAGLRPDLQLQQALGLPLDPFQNSGPRRLLLADASRGKLVLLRETALETYDLLWEHPIRNLHDLHWVAEGRVLFQTDWTELLEVDLASGAVLWRYDARKQNRPPGEAPGTPLEVHSFQRLEDGSTLLAESGPGRVLVVDAQGQQLRAWPLKRDHPDAHSDTRLVRLTPSGSLLVAHERDGVVREYDATGQVLWSYAVPLFDRTPAGGHGPEAFGNQVFGAERLENGNTRIATGNGHQVIEVNPEGEIVWSFGPKDVPQFQLAWITTVQELPNGHLIINNCHAGPDQPQLIEIDREKREVWTFRDFERLGNGLSNAWVLPDPERDGSTATPTGPQ